MSEQLTLGIGEPGYYSWQVWDEKKMSGSCAVSWHDSEGAARDYAIARFNRGYKSWPEDRRPVIGEVKAEILVASDFIGKWGELTQEQRDGFTKSHPWFTDKRRVA